MGLGLGLVIGLALGLEMGLVLSFRVFSPYYLELFLPHNITVMRKQPETSKVYLFRAPN